jgi:serine protease Do
MTDPSAPQPNPGPGPDESASASPDASADESAAPWIDAGATAPASPEVPWAPAPAGRYSPDPEPRPDWARPTYQTPPERSWFDPKPTTAPVTPPRSERRGAGVGTGLAAALISAVLASGGTVVALQATGTLDAPAATTPAPPAEPAATRQPVASEGSSAVVDVAASAGPAVVRISSTTEAVVTDPLAIPEQGVGSGFIYDPAGWILTNRHVVEGSNALTVELADGRQFEGTIYGIDTLTDLAIVKIEADGLPTVPLGESGELQVGQLTIAIGSPLGTYSNSVTAGILSASGRQIQVDGGQLSNLLQTDTAINPGNSGGPLLDAGGAVIGINTAIATSAEGIGFAIPIDLAKPIMRQAVAGESLARPYIGVRFETIDLRVVEREGLDVEDGALVARDAENPNGGTVYGVVPGGPADQAGLEPGDVIVKVGDVALDGEHPLDAVVSQFSPGETVEMIVIRGGEQLTVSLVLGTRPADL